MDGSYFTIDDARELRKPRNLDSHKGNYGHALLQVGSIGMMGAAILSTKACIRSGVGLTTVLSDSRGNDIMQISVPEAMFLRNEYDYSKYDAIACGCGIGTSSKSYESLLHLLKGSTRNLVLDADAINLIAKFNLQSIIPENTILTPHDIEFDRIVTESKNHDERIGKAVTFARNYKLIIVLKGHKTAVISPDGTISFNTTGNPGMATGGSGDVLTGLIVGLLAQKYKPYDAAKLGVFLHGLSGDFAAEELSQEAMTSGDIVNYLSKAFKAL